MYLKSMNYVECGDVGRLERSCLFQARFENGNVSPHDDSRTGLILPLVVRHMTHRCASLLTHFARFFDMHFGELLNAKLLIAKFQANQQYGITFAKSVSEAGFMKLERCEEYVN